MQIGTLLTVLIYFTGMLGIGFYARKESSENISAYLLGGRQLGPAVTALSAGASDMSAWLLMGLPGAMFVSGFSSGWIAIGLVIGAYFNYLLVAPRLRVYTELARDAITIPDYFENRFKDSSHILRIISSLVIIVFFTIYTSSGVVAGGVLFESSFGLSYSTGIWVTAGVVVAYTLMGGFRAVCITDFVQASIMILALLIVPLVALTELGGLSSVTGNIIAFSPQHLSLFSGVAATAIISNMAWGLGYFGQPHIIVRFMAIRSVKEIKVARKIGMSWMIVSISGALMTGFVGLAYVLENEMTLADPETIFIVLSQLLFHPFIAGFFLAAILAAIMSTISSQLLVSSSSLSEDFYKPFVRKLATGKELVLVSRGAVVLVALLAILLAQNRESTILSLVSNAWAGFGAAFGPLILMSLLWKKMNRAGAIAGIVTGALTVLFWIYTPFSINGQSLSSIIYEIVPGFLLSTVAIFIFTTVTGGATEDIKAEFSQMESRLP